LTELHCCNNPFLDCYVKRENYIFMVDYIVEFRNQIKIINQFRELFYALKCKKQLKKWLWHIREPKIRNKYKPENLIAMLEGREDNNSLLTKRKRSEQLDGGFLRKKRKTQKRRALK
jgi:hypothetical protein